MFANRIEAGRQLATLLSALRGEDVVVLGLPRGGVPVAAEVAKALDAPLDVVVVRKLGLPGEPEVAIGAVGEDGVRVLDDSRWTARAPASDLLAVEQREVARLHEQVQQFRRGRDRIDPHGRVALIVDDGIATGATARAACLVARGLHAARIVLAAPVAPGWAADAVPEADQVVSVISPADLVAIGCHYQDFTPTTDAEVIEALDAAARRIGERTTAGDDLDLEVVASRGERARRRAWCRAPVRGRSARPRLVRSLPARTVRRSAERRCPVTGRPDSGSCCQR